MKAMKALNRDTDDIRRLFRSAAEVVAGLQLRDGVVTGRNARTAEGAFAIEFAIESPAIAKPRLPTTRDGALPQFLLRGPFQGAPTLHGVAFYIGLGIISVRETTPTRYSYELAPIDGNGVDARLKFLVAARDLFFNDVQFEGSSS